MKSHLLCLTLFLLSVSAAAVNDVRIVEVGVKGYYSTVTPTPVLVELRAPSHPGPIRLDFTVSIREPNTGILLRNDHFSRIISTKPGETIQADSPVLLAGSTNAELQVVATSAGGEKIGSSSVNLGSLSSVGNQSLIAILCRDNRLCDEAQAQISFSSVEDEVTEKSKSLRFAALALPREHWWDYSAVRFLVVAGSMRGWTSEQRSAVEYYVRRGGTLLLLEEEADDHDFLAAYRQRPIKSDPIHVGEGRLYRIADLPGKALNSLFSGGSYKDITGNQLSFPNYLGGNLHGRLRRTVGVSFDFPRLRWVLIWLGIYIVIVGLVNFTLLRRWRRLEWGWVTTAGIAVLFAFALYISGSMRRPKQVQLDDITVYRMDTRSPVAAVQIDLRVSSPSRLATTVSVGPDAVLRSENSGGQDKPNAEIAMEITGNHSSPSGWEMNLGPPAELQLDLLRWSFADLDLQAFHVFPGSVTIDSDLRLSNHTGQQFREGMYLDFDRNQKFFVPSLAPEQQIATNNLSSTAIWKDVEINQFVSRQPVVDESANNQHPLPLRAIPYTAFEFGPGTHFFVGVSDAPAPDTNLTGTQFVRQNFVVTIVSLDQP